MAIQCPMVFPFAIETVMVEMKMSTSGAEKRIYVPGKGGSSGKIETFKVFESKKAIQDHYLEESAKACFSLLYTKMWLQSNEQQQILGL